MKIGVSRITDLGAVFVHVMNTKLVPSTILNMSKVFFVTSQPFHALVTNNGKHIYIYKSNITCDKDKVSEMKLLMLMLMNAWMMLMLMKCKCPMHA